LLFETENKYMQLLSTIRNSKLLKVAFQVMRYKKRFFNAK